MKFKEILLMLKEQPEDEPNQDELDPQGNPIDGEDDNIIRGNEPIDPADLEVPEPEEPAGAQPSADSRTSTPHENYVALHKKEVSKSLNAIDEVKIEWVTQAENSGITISEADMQGAIEFFNSKKNNLIELHDPPRPNDVPQLFALHQRFPNFPVYDRSRIRDIQNYTWEQIMFFMERYVEVPQQDGDQPIEEVERIEIKGVDDLTRFLPQAYEMWENEGKNIYKDENLIVKKIESKSQSIALGILQNALRDKYKTQYGGSNHWCTTLTSGSNLYTGYRDWRAFYYILNKNVPENHEYRLFALGAVISNNNNGPYTLSNLYNDKNNISLSFDDVIATTECPQLENLRSRLVWFSETKKESMESIFDSYTFDGAQDSDFAFLRPSAQFLYIDNGRNIKSAKTLRSLGEAEINGTKYDLQSEYARRTTAQNIHSRYKTQDPSEGPFDMINALRPKVKKFLNNAVLITQQGIPDGIYAIIAVLLENSLTKSYKDLSNPNIRLFQSKNTAGLFGIFNLDTYEWEKPLEYSKQKWNQYVERNGEGDYISLRYVSDTDYFYWLFNRSDLLNKDKTNPNYLKGKFVEGAAGDEMFSKLIRVK